MLKIAHVCMSCFYIDDAGYQENKLVAAHISQGHDVRVFTSTETYNKKGVLHYVEPRKYIGSDGAEVHRLPYRGWIPFFLARKIRSVVGLEDLLIEFNPEMIIFHGLAGWELFTISKFKRNSPDCIVCADSHEDYNNTARTFFSYILNRFFYRKVLKLNLATLSKIFYISLETKDFIKDIYDVPESVLDYLPLGGNIKPESEANLIRSQVRKEFGLSSDTVVFLQSGKFNPRKKLKESLESFQATTDPRFRFWIAGVVDDSLKGYMDKAVQSDPRISYFGWVHSGRLENLLLASDVYLQPGTQSVTMQASLCAGCVVAIADVKSHQPYVKSNGWLLGTQHDLENMFEDISSEKVNLAEMKLQSLSFAKENLDYNKLAARIVGLKV